METGKSGGVKYRRILLKLSGESLQNKSKALRIDPEVVAAIAARVKAVWSNGVQVAVVVGGGNIFRGSTGASHGIDRSTGDYMGMLATVINALALQNAMEKTGVPTRVKLPSLPIVLKVVPFGARPTTSAPSPAASRKGASSRTMVAVPLTSCVLPNKTPTPRPTVAARTSAVPAVPWKRWRTPTSRSGITAGPASTWCAWPG